jgi:hypothetical protein
LVGEHQSELDSHADTTCVSDQAVILKVHLDELVEVTPFLATLGSVLNAFKVTAALAYDDPRTGHAILLIYHQVLHIPGMKSNLLCPMQLRHSGVTVNDRPKHCTPTPSVDDHTIVFSDGFVIPLKLDGVTSYFTTRTPTAEELNQYPGGDYYEVTASFPEWDPSSDLFQILEDRLADADGSLLYRPHRHPRQLYSLLTTRHLDHPFYPYCLEGSGIGIARSDVGALRRQIKPNQDNIKQLAAAWNIGLPLAERTLQVTTQNAVREYDGRTGSAERRYPRGDRSLRYNQLGHSVYTDTFYCKYKSSKGSTCAQMYCTDFCWSRNYPMKSESSASHTLDEFFHQYGVPLRLIPDNAKALTQGEFASVARKARCPIDPVDKHSPFQNRAEGEIREVKRHAGRDMTRSAAPAKLWDYCTVRSSLIRSHTALPIYRLQGKTPEAVMRGITPDISFLAKFGWYEWVYVNPPGKTSFADGSEELCRYLTPTEPGKGSVLSHTVLRETGATIDTTTVRRLRPQEIENRDIQRKMDAFDESIEAKLGPPVSEKEFLEGKKNDSRRRLSLAAIDVAAVTPHYEPYEDDEETHTLTSQLPISEGIVPETMLNSISKLSIFFHWPKDDGMLPDKLLSHKAATLMLVQLPSSGARVPVRSLSWKYASFMLVQLPSSDGNVPDRLLSLR